MMGSGSNNPLCVGAAMFGTIRGVMDAGRLIHLGLDIYGVIH